MFFFLCSREREYEREYESQHNRSYEYDERDEDEVDHGHSREPRDVKKLTDGEHDREKSPVNVERSHDFIAEVQPMNRRSPIVQKDPFEDASLVDRIVESPESRQIKDKPSR